MPTAMPALVPAERDFFEVGEEDEGSDVFEEKEVEGTLRSLPSSCRWKPLDGERTVALPDALQYGIDHD